MRIGIGTRGGRRFAIDPYALFDAAFDPDAAGGYVVGGGTSTLVNLATSGSGGDLVQAGAGIQPILTGPALVFDGNDYLQNTTDLPAITDTAAFVLTVNFNPTSIANSPVIWATVATAANPRLAFQVMSSGRGRVYMRDSSNTNISLIDTYADGLSELYATGTDYALSFAFESDTMTILRDGIPIYDGTAFALSGQDTAYGRFVLGALRINATVSTPLTGTISHMTLTGL